MVSKANGTISLVSQTPKLSRTPAEITTAAPEAGEHTDGILAEIGYSAEEIAKFRATGVV